MVQRVKVRGHLIRFYGMQPSTSRKPPEKCTTCGFYYNDGKKRKCEFLCCPYRYPRCFDCVLKSCKINCPRFMERDRVRRKKMKKTVMKIYYLNDKNEDQTGQGMSEVVADAVIGDGGKEIGGNFTNERLVETPVKLEGTKVEAAESSAVEDVTTEIPSDEDTLIDCKKCSSIKDRLEALIPKEHLKPKVVLERVTIKAMDLCKRKPVKTSGVSTNIAAPATRKSERVRKVIKWESL